MRNSKGSVLLGAVIMISILAMILVGVDTNAQGGSGLMSMVSSEHSWVQRDYANTAAINLAEAGLEKALDDIATSWSNGTTYNQSETFTNVGSYTVQTISSTASSYTLKATGTVSVLGNAITRDVQITVNKGNSGSSPYAIVSGGNMEFDNSASVLYQTPAVGLYANGNFEMTGAMAVYTVNQSGQTVFAGVTASGDIEVNGALAANPKTENAPQATLPSVDFAALLTQSSNTINGNLEQSGGSLGANNTVTYIKGNLELNGNVTAAGTIVVDGNVEVDGTIKPANGQYLEILTKGNFEYDDPGISLQPELVATVYAQGNVELDSGSPWIKGAVIASGNFEFEGGALVLTYQANPNTKISYSGGTTVQDWKEIY